MPEALSDEATAWHRKTGARCNNRGWELSEQRSRTPAEDRELLDVAHAAAYHWGQVGTELNRMRATTLLAQVHALLGHGRTALAMAGQVRDYFLAKADTPDWELALTHAIHANAARAAGDAAAHQASYAKAQAALAAIADPEDRAVVDKTFSVVPAP